MLEQTEWSEYKLSDLFESFNGDFDIKKEHINGLGEYVITAGESNNGIAGKTDISSRIFDRRTITVDMFGFAFYRNFQYKMVTHARVFNLIPKSEITENQGIFIANSLHFLKHSFGYENMCSWNKIKNLHIQLPQKEGKIDYQFMEDFIAELEQASIAELEAYLIATGLNDYILTDKECAVLKLFEQDKARQGWNKYDLEDIFNIKNATNLIKTEIMNVNGKIPYVSASQDNNGVSAYIEHYPEMQMSGNTLFIGGKTFTVFYQPNNYFSNDSHNLWLELKDEKSRNELNYLFMATAIRRSLNGKYEWGNSISRAKIKSDSFMLPTKEGNPNYEFMATFISAIQKLVIKDVVLYTGVKVKATKRVVNYPKIQNQ